MSRHTVKASTICGTHVENWDGENLGTVTDIMLDKHEGTITYFVLSYPGDYAIFWPNKRFAVPFEAVARKQTPDGGIEYLLNVDAQLLQRSPGFDVDHWPDFADEKFTSVLHDFYKDVKLDMVA